MEDTANTANGTFVHCGIEFTEAERESWRGKNGAKVRFEHTLNAIVRSGDPRRNQVKKAATEFGLIKAVLQKDSLLLLGIKS